MNKIVGVIILNWNGYRDTIDCISSVLKSDYEHIQIILVDNNSDFDEGSRLERLFRDSKNIHVLKNSVNSGYCGGNNLGAQLCFKKSYQYLMVLNNDTVIDTKMVSFLVASIEANPDTAAINPIVFQYYKKDIIENAGLSFSLWHGIVRQIHFGEKNPAKFSRPDALSGTCFLLKSAVLEKIQYLFDQDYFCYYEDPDLSIRIKKAGYNIAVEPAAILWHKGLASSKKISGFAEYQSIKNRFLIEKKNASWFQKITFFSVDLFLYFPFRILRIVISPHDGNLRYFLKGFAAGVRILFGGRNTKFS